MNFEPQCKTRADLHDHMARVLRMCEAAGFDRPWECVKFEGQPCSTTYGMLPALTYNPHCYEFALAIVEGRPVFRGDVLYEVGIGGVKFTAVNSDSNAVWAMNGNERYYFSFKELTWNPPQRTIEINGVKVKAPITVETSEDAAHPERHGIFITFKYSEDAEAFKAAMERKMQ